MIAVRGTTTWPGTAIGIGVRCDARGAESVPAKLLQEAALAVKQGLPDRELPQAIFLCDQVETALAIRIRGVRVAGIAARRPVPAGLRPEVPCLADMGQELERIGEDQIIILDATRGVLYADPDARTIQKYERLITEAREARPFFLDAEHMPARTMDGRVVTVAAVLTSRDSIGGAVAEGADELILHTDEGAELGEAIAACAGTDIIVVTDLPTPELLWPALWVAAPGQVSFALPAADYESLRQRVEESTGIALGQIPEATAGPTEVRYGIVADRPLDAPDGAEFLLIWLEPKDAARVSAGWESTICPVRTIIVLGKNLDAARIPVERGVQAIAVAPGLVAEAKNLIRALPPDFVV